ncbi:helix-turn-helix domain-containing protein [Neptuniibacter sp.]|uniref:helix-turn-helix domain-containing protein n=1 Tax=Neptuniibacter sp. TaxID=1962643 RepID=UPI00261EEDE9|nr:helix-turn-helix domain-containing protein [Neptuniibacter sp.]MCP4598555.1 transposase [Neptuniibacter sp.]
MSKYSREFKCCVARQCLGGITSRHLARQHSISSRQIRYWAQVFAIHGDESFLATQHACTAQSKLQALSLMWKNDWSITHTSAVLNLTSPGILSIWLKRYTERGIKGLETNPLGRPPTVKKQSQRTVKPDHEMTLEELKEELAYLRAENAVLKKWEELEQEKSRRAKKKRP